MKRKLISILLSFCMVLPVLSVLPLSAAAGKTGFSDMPAENYWSYQAIASALENGLLQGDSGKLRPRESLTRAELAAVLNRAFGAEATADISGYSDVKASSWYYRDIAKAVRMGTLQGSGGGIMRPDAPVTRQEAFLILARSMKLAGGDAAMLGAFSDRTDVSSWAASALAAMVQAGYVNGSNGELYPTGTITREEFAQVMYNIFSLYISEPKTYTNDITGNALINSDDVTLRGLTVSGDLILGEGVGNGDITLDDVTVTGRLVVRAGGENSIHIINSSKVGNIIVGKTGDGGVRVRTEEGCRVDVVYVDDGLDNVILEGSFNQVTITTDTTLVLRDATVTGLTVSGTGADVKLQGSTTILATQITESAAGATLEVGSGAKVTKVESAAESVTISGTGTVTQAMVSGDNTAVNTSGTKVTVGEGTTGVTQNGIVVRSQTPSGGSTGGSSGGGSPSYTVAVTSLAELQAALSNGSVSAVTIRESITIPEGKTVTFNKPVTIADMPGSILIISGELVNNSTFISRGLGGFFEDTGIELDGSFVNNGAFENNSRFGMFKATFTNNGTVNNKDWLHCGGTSIINNKTFHSIGDISLLNANSWDEEDDVPSTFTNGPEATLVAEGPGGILVRLTCSFNNAGTATVKAYLENYGTITNTGTFTYTERVVNAGTINGTLTASGEYAELENDIPVSTFEDLKAQTASLDAGYDGIAIVGDITLTEDLTVSRHVRLTPDGRLEVPHGKTLIVTSTSGYNGLDVSGKFEIAGTLVTTRSGSGEDECVGQVTLLGGALRAMDKYVIENNGVIKFFFGEIDPESIVVHGNPIEGASNIIAVTSEEALLNAMDDPGVEEISIEADITVTSSLDITKRTTVTYDTLATTPRTLTVSPGATVTVRDGGSLSILGSVSNRGTFIDGATGDGVFMGTTGTFTNESTATLNVDNRFDIMEGTLTNNGSVSISAGYEHTILVMGGIVTNNGEFINDGCLDMGVSTGHEGALHDRGTTFTNTGTFANGGISTPAQNSYFGMISGTFENSGDFTNNGNMDISYTGFSHSDGTFTTYNSGGLSIVGGSFSTEGADPGSFSNEGYMRIVDQYGKDGQDYVCDIDLATGTLDNDSNWLDYAAAAYSEAGVAAAEAAQQSKKTALGSGDNYFGFSVYNRLDFMADMMLTGAANLGAFETYWVESYWVWDGETSQDVEVSVEITVESGAVLTVGNNCSLNVHGALHNNGTIVTAAPYDEGDIHFNGGCVDIWPEGTFINNPGSTIENKGDVYIRHEYRDSDDAVLQANVTGLSSVSTRFIALVHNEADLAEANSCVSPVYDRIEVKGDSIIFLTGRGTLTIDKDVYVEPGSGLIVNYGKTLAFVGSHWIHNGGDMSVYGEMNIGDGVWFFNSQNLEIGVSTGGEAATVTILSGGNLQNDGDITVYATGTLDAGAGNYHGNAPSVQGGAFVTE